MKFVGILIILFLINLKKLIIAILLILLSIFIFFSVIKKKVQEYGEKKTLNSGLLIKYITEGFSSIKEIHLSQNPSYFSNLLKKYAQENAIVQVKFKNLNFFPRQALEVFTVILLCLLIYYLSVSNIVMNLHYFY